MNLRDIAEAAGSIELTAQKSEDLSKSGKYGLRILYIQAVAGIYRPARQHLRHDDQVNQLIGKIGMGNCLIALQNARVKYQAEGDPAMAILCLHSIGTVQGWLGYRLEQVFNNWAVWKDSRDEGISEEDGQFLRDKAMAALLEHAFEDFVEKESISDDDLLKFVDGLFNRKAPDAPGRALWFARRMLDKKVDGKPIPIHENTTAKRLIQRACAATEFGKPDQVADAEALFKELYAE